MIMKFNMNKRLVIFVLMKLMTRTFRLTAPSVKLQKNHPST